MFAKLKQKTIEEQKQKKKDGSTGAPQANVVQDGGKVKGSRIPIPTGHEGRLKAVSPPTEQKKSLNTAPPQVNEGPPLQNSTSDSTSTVDRSQSTSSEVDLMSFTSPDAQSASGGYGTPTHSTKTEIEQEKGSADLTESSTEKLVTTGSKSEDGLTDKKMTQQVMDSPHSVGQSASAPQQGESGGDSPLVSREPPTDDTHSPAVSTQAAQLFDSTKQLGSRMFGLLRNRLQQQPDPESEDKPTSAPSTPQTPLTPSGVPEGGSLEEDNEFKIQIQNLSKDELIVMVSKERQLKARYKKKCNELVDAYRNIEKQNGKLQTTLQTTQDKSMTRIKELKEAADLDYKAKAHMEEYFRQQLEEKDQKIEVLSTQVQLMKNQVFGEKGENLSEQTQQAASGDTRKVEVEELSEKVKKLEGLLARYKEGLKLAKEKVTHLAEEKEMMMKELKSKQEDLNALQESKASSDKDLVSKEDLDAVTLAKEELQSELLKVQTKLENQQSRSGHLLNTAKQEFERVKQELEQCKAEKNKIVELLSDELENLKSVVKEKESSISHLQGELAASKEKESVIEQLQGELAVSKEKESVIEQLQGELAASKEKESVIEQLQGELAASKEKESVIEQLQGELAVSKEKESVIEQLQGELAVSKEKESVIEQLQGELAVSKEKESVIEQLQGELAVSKEKESVIEQLQGELAVSKEKESVIEQLQGELAASKEKESVIEQLQGELAASKEKESVIEQLQGELAMLKEKSDKESVLVQNQTDELRAEISALREELTENRGVIERSTKEAIDLRSQLEQLGKERDEIASDCQTQIENMQLESETKVRDVEEQWDRMVKEERSQHEFDLKEMKSLHENELLKNASSQESELHQLREKHNQECQELSTQMKADMESSLARLRDSLAIEHSHALSTLQHKLDESVKIRGEVEASNAQLQEQIHILLDDKSGEDQIHKTLRDQVASLEEKIHILTNERSVALEESTSLKLQLEKLSNQMRLLQEDVESHEQVCHEMETKMKDSNSEWEQRYTDLKTSYESKITEMTYSLEEKSHEISKLSLVHKEEENAQQLQHQAELERLQTEEEDMKKALSHRLEETKDMYESKLASLSNALETQQNQNEESNEKLKEMAFEREQLHHERDEILTRMNSLEEKLTAKEDLLIEEKTQQRQYEEALKKLQSDNQNKREEEIGEMEDKISTLSAAKETLASQLDKREEEMKLLHQTVLELEGELALKKDSQIEVEESHKMELLQLKDDNQSRLTQMEKEIATSLEEKQAILLSSCQERHQKELADLKEQHEVKLQDVQKQHGEILEKVKKQAKSKIEVLRKSKEESAQLSASNSHQVDDLKIQVTELESQLSETKQGELVLQEQIKSSLAQKSLLEEKLREMEHQMKDITSEHAKSLQQLGEQKDEEIKSALAGATSLQTQVQEEQSVKRKELEQHLKEKQASLDNLQTNFERLKMEMETLSQEKATTLTSLTQQKQAEQVKMADYDKQAQALLEEVNDLKAKVHVKDQELAETKTMLDNRAKEVMDLQKHLQDTESQVEENRLDIKKKAEAKLASIKQQFTTQLEAANLKRKNEAEAWQNKETQHSEQITALESARNEAIQNSQQLSKELNVLQKEKEDLAASLLAVKEGYSQMEKDLMARQSTVDGLSNQLVSERSLLQTKEDLLQSLEDTVVSWQKKAEQLESQVKEMESKEHSNQEDVQRQLLEGEAIKTELQNKVDQLQKDLKESKDHFQKRKSDWKEKHNLAQEEWEKKMVEVSQKAQEDHQETAESHKLQVDQLSRNIETLQRELESLQTQHRSLDEECKQTKDLLDAEVQKTKLLETNLSSLQENQRQELEAAKYQMEEEAASRYGNKLTQLTEQLKVNDLRKETEELQARLDHFGKQHDLEVSQLTSELEETQEELKRLRQEENNYKSKVDSLSLELKEAQDQMVSSSSRNKKNDQILKDYKQLLKDSEDEKLRLAKEKRKIEDESIALMGETESLKEEKIKSDDEIQRLSDLVDELQEKLTMATEGRGNGSFQTPQSQRGTSTTMSSLDTPSKYVTLAEEPHGAEFEYFKNVLFQYMIGKETKQLARALTALARFNKDQASEIIRRHS